MENNLKALNDLLDFTTPKQLRTTILKLFFHRQRGVASGDDEEEVFLLLMFLEKIKEKPAE